MNSVLAFRVLINWPGRVKLVRQTQRCVGVVEQLVLKLLSLVNWLSQHGGATLYFVATFWSYLGRRLQLLSPFNIFLAGVCPSLLSGEFEEVPQAGL